jgi:hypothetical protein
MSMKAMKWLVLIVAVAMIVSFGAYAMAADAPKDSPKTITGKSSCGGCTGVTGSCCVLLTDKAGGRWALKGDSESVKAAFKDRSAGKIMTATLAGKPVAKKDKDGKDYMEVKVSEVKVKS